MVGVGGEQEPASRLAREDGQGGVEVLASRKAVDLDEHPPLGRGREHHLPVRPDPRPARKQPPPGVGERPYPRFLQRPQQPAGLIPPFGQRRVHRRHQQHPLARRAWEVQPTVLQDLDLKPLDEPQLLAVPAVPRGHRAQLQLDPLGVQTVHARETAGVVGHHGPRGPPAHARPRHRLQRAGPVRGAGVPVNGTPQLTRVECRI